MNKKKVKELEDTMVQLEEKSANAIKKLESLKSSTDETIETKVAQQLNLCLSRLSINILILTYHRWMRPMQRDARDTSGTKGAV
ncbi:hypothetical protein FNV43_RR19389 [Rhamnella rubrinervis]|uniref:Uncharacterized protein n=1 Tax=Rhamnella rubrinervis TaxID=2594499 RepID=A0A8K0DWQ2_9ROSA|nr:hypothetical protein FNV43_RR19389 [Rhamnella rubrinervis]